ncbi:HIR complex subunit [Dissophora globulifera]|uniref:Protein HIR n=1 Tax=Dissophora globulifera TaxID=979702 RepID=A0A9P6RSJ7_9FUNG|nr:HIR complex subunit [Dissophora globulifera]
MTIDVTDVAWSPENTYLASAGLDSKIIIWDGRTFDRVITLDQHQGFVKGLTWDPVGKYMASQSDDKSVRIWRITDWEVEVEVTEPFSQSSGTTFFRRLSWSPDGGHIATANAFSGVDKPVPVASVITRDNWRADISLVGHSAPVEVVAFNPLLFKYTDASGSIGFTSICAVGSQDRGITVWRTHEPKAFVAIKELFEHSFLDLSWTPDGQSLFACSYDGTVAVLLFQSENLGEAVPAEERHRLLAKYGYERRGEIMAETPLQLAMEEQLKESSAKSRMDQVMQHDSSMEGVTSTFAKPSDPSVFANATVALISPSTTISAPPVSQVHIVASEQTVTMTSDGKKRIKPLFLGNGMGAVTAPTPQIQPIVHPVGGQHPSIGMTDGVGRGEPSMAIPDGGFPTVVIGTKRKDPPTNGVAITGGPAKKASEAGAKGKAGPQRNEEDVTSRLAIASPLLAVSKVRLGVPRVRSHITRNRAGLECHNSISGEQPSRVVYSQKGAVVWTDYLPSSVLLMTGNSQFTAVACEDGGLYVYSPAGRRNVIQQVAVLSSVSISPILQPSIHAAEVASTSVSITSATVRQNGLPLLTTSAGQGYTYHERMKIWAAATGGRLEKDVAFAQELLNVEESVQSVVTLTHLENQMAAAQVLGSASEYRQWLRCYVQRLADESAVARVEELCKYLLGPVYQGGERSGWQPTILGFQKRELLKELLPVLSSNRSLQRIVKEYLSGLEMVTKSSAAASSLSGASSSVKPAALHTALYEWGKECPKDLRNDLDNFFASRDFLDREGVFFKGVDDSNEKWVALITMQGLDETWTMICSRLQYSFAQLHEAKGTTFSQVAPAPRMPVVAAYHKFVKDIVKANKARRIKEKVKGWSLELARATEMTMIAPKLSDATAESSTSAVAASAATAATASVPRSSSSSSSSSASSFLTPRERAAASSGMWFISVDIESYERDHSKILEIGWSVWDSRINKFVDRHYAISDYRHLQNGRYVADRRDRFMFGDTVWATLEDSIAAFQDDLETAAKLNEQGLFALIAHDMSSDETYLRKMGVEFPRGMIKFDTLLLNAARSGDSNKTGLGRLLDQLEIENYSLHNAGNDAHYTLELFMWLTRDYAKRMDAKDSGSQ